MKRAIWFKAACIGNVPVHWAPITTQGWVVVGVFLVALLGAMRLNRHPTLMTAFACGLVALLIGVAAATDDRAR